MPTDEQRKLIEEVLATRQEAIAAANLASLRAIERILQKGGAE